MDRAYLFYNPKGGLCSYYGANTDYFKSKLNIEYHEITLDNHFCCNDNFIKLASVIDNRTHNSYMEEKINEDVPSLYRYVITTKIGNGPENNTKS